ncbi:MAG: VWA domain-containing protein [Acidobacteria bacterium]|nr:VWA domain-containing protein [Acidobacteriota bacterium]
MPRIPRLLLLASLIFLLALPPRLGAAKKGDTDHLCAEHQRWLDSVELIISKEERTAFLDIEKKYQRDAFIERFWRTRDPYPDTARNEFRERWERRAEEAALRFRSLLSDRSRIFLLNGEPSVLIPIRCGDLYPAEVWYYERAETLGSKMALLFYERAPGIWRLWLGDRLGDLLRFGGFGSSGAQVVEAIRNSCRFDQEEALFAVLKMAQRSGGLGYTMLVAEMQEYPEKPSGEWVATFHAYSTQLEEGIERFPATLTIDFPGRRQSRTIMQALVSVPKAEVGRAELAGHTSYNLLATGEILLGDRLFENFRYRFNMSDEEILGEQLPLMIERTLRPGKYRLIVKLEDLNSDKVQRLTQDIEVPDVSGIRPRIEDAATRLLFEEANRAISITDTTLALVEPYGDLQAGLLRIDTLTTGDEIDHVTFLMEGQPILTKRRPPFTVELDLGNMPRLRTLTAIAYDAEDNELVRDQMVLNASSHRFDIRLVEPRRGQKYERSLRAEARVQVPDGKVVERVEFYLNETEIATLYQPPWVQTVLVPPGGELAYVRVVAVQPDGNSTEDLVFVNAPDYLEEVDIQFVELYVAVLDRNRRPVDGLTETDFTVREDGIAQETTRFDKVSNLPIHAGILLDTSASMEGSIEDAKLAALSFFEQIITPKDRATLITFSDSPYLAAKFTNQLRDIGRGLAGLKAERGTALYDSLVFALQYFNGIKGQRALILLSDGQDEHSRFPFDDTLEFAQRAGVAIYSIGLNLPSKLRASRKELIKFAEKTGGRAFFVDDSAELPAIYDIIQNELRSRYYIAYQSTNTAPSEEFRSIEVKLSQRDLEAKTLLGYYP